MGTPHGPPRATRYALVTCVAAAALFTPIAAQAQSTVYTTFGTGDAYITGAALEFSGLVNTTAVGFTYRGPSGLALNTLRFAFFNFSADWTLEASFWEGPTMNSAVQREVWTGITGASRIVTLASTESVELTDGNTYWFTGTAAGGSSNISAGINYNSAGISDLVAFDRRPFNGNWEIQPAYLAAAWEVNAAPVGTPVPEPASLALLCAGGLALAAFTRRRRVTM